MTLRSGVSQKGALRSCFFVFLFMIWMDAKTRDLKVGGVPKRVPSDLDFVHDLDGCAGA